MVIQKIKGYFIGKIIIIIKIIIIYSNLCYIK